MSTFLVRGDDYLNRFPEFRLIGRDGEVKELASILMRKKANSVLLVGPAGVGSTALCLGLSAMKRDPNAPLDIVSKRFYWLDTDGLFSSGDSQQINLTFQQSVAVLWRQPDAVLIIKDTRNFIEASERAGCGHFANALTNAVRNDKVQVILEVRDSDLDYVLKYHSDIRENYTLMDIHEPTEVALHAIIEGTSRDLEIHHGIKISADARKAAADLTQKYPDALSEAQPSRAVTLLDRALASYRLKAHHTPPVLVALQTRINAASDAERPALEAQLVALTRHWAEKQERIKKIYNEMREGEEAIRALEDEIADLKRQEQDRADKRNADEDAKPSAFRGASAFMAVGALDSPAVAERRQKIKFLEAAVAELRNQFAGITAEVNEGLELDRAAVTSEFSAISGISADKLNENEILILRNLETVLKSRVYGQDHVLVQVANGIKVARIGGLNGSKPQASYLFIGPSGVGKTEVAKALSEALGLSLLRFDMSEYMEKHGVAKLIGAPPGYEGFEAGGTLTNAMRKNRKRLILFDEAEKAHPDVFNLMLQMLDDGRLTDNVGRTADFSESIILLTSNIGQPFFLDKDLDFDAAIALANRELEERFRPEFLNRFAGRENIICFKRLELGSIERIVRREVDKIHRAYSQRGLSAVFEDEGLQAFCRQRYDPKMGARGLPGVITNRLESVIVNRILEAPGSQGTFHISYDETASDFLVEFEERQANRVAA